MTTQVAKGDDIALLVEQLAMESGGDRREEGRFTGSVAVEVQRLTDKFEPTGPAERGIARNISTSGIAIMYNDAVECNFLALRLLPPGDHDPIELIMKVARCRPVGDFFDIGGTFVTR